MEVLSCLSLEKETSRLDEVNVIYILERVNKSHGKLTLSECRITGLFLSERTTTSEVAIMLYEFPGWIVVLK